MNKPQSLTITTDPNKLQITVHNITQNPNNDQTQNDTTHNTIQYIQFNMTILLPYLHQILM